MPPWAAAQRAHELAPPDAGFAERLRGTASAASIEAAALEYAITAGLTGKEPWPTAPQFAPRAQRGRPTVPGDPNLWEKWDETVKDGRTPAQGTRHRRARPSTLPSARRLRPRPWPRASTTSEASPTLSRGPAPGHLGVRLGRTDGLPQECALTCDNLRVVNKIYVEYLTTLSHDKVSAALSGAGHSRHVQTDPARPSAADSVNPANAGQSRRTQYSISSRRRHAAR